MGPTASGKTALALQLANKFNIEVISVDSALIYRGMDIGTAKPTAAEQAQVPHHLIDILDPTAHYSAGQFVQDATRLIEEIRQRGCAPLLVGGTMLYFKALQFGLAKLPSQDPILRADIAERANKLGWGALYNELVTLDPEWAAQINPHDTQRISRGLEVFYRSGEPLSQLQKQTTRPTSHPIMPLALIPENRAVLHERIAMRVEQMLNQGLIEEIKALRQQYSLHAGLPSMRAVGYRQVWQFLEGGIQESDLANQILFATRQYAKRQLTWLKTWPALQALPMEDPLEQITTRLVQAGLPLR